MRSYDLKPVKDATKDLDKCTYEYITCAYFNGNRELKSVYTDQLSRLPREDALKHFAILKESLKGTVNRNIFTAGFSEEEKEDGGLKSILASLAGAAGNEAIVMKLCGRILEAMEFESGVNYLMTAAWNTIDIKPKGTDRQTIDDASEFSFSYCLVSVCPAKLSDPGLSYDENTKTFRTRITDWVVEKPALAILYPAPMGEGADMGHAVVFSKAKDPEITEEFIKAFTGNRAPVSIDKGFGCLKDIICETVDYKACPEVLESIDEKLEEYCEDHKMADNAVLSKATLKDVIMTSVGADRLPETFADTFEETFMEKAGEDEIPVYAVKPLAEALKKNAVVIRTDSLDIIEKRILDGVEYIVIPVSEGVSIEEKKK